MIFLKKRAIFGIIYLFSRPPHEKDCPQYEEVQRVLREEIVNPLRKNFYVRADRVMKLRTLLEKLSSISGLTSEEKGTLKFYFNVKYSFEFYQYYFFFRSRRILDIFSSTDTKCRTFSETEFWSRGISLSTFCGKGRTS